MLDRHMACEMTKECILNKRKRELEKKWNQLNIKIVLAVNNEKFSLQLDEKLDSELVDRLKCLGYDVTYLTSQIICSHGKVLSLVGDIGSIIISWEEKV